MDEDGLTDDQEMVIGTSPYVADTDGDGFSDLEEHARNSDPLDRTSIPQSEPFDVGTCASLDGGYVSMASTIYADAGHLESIRLDVGFVYQGRVLHFSPKCYMNSRGFLYRGHDANSNIAVIELAIPQALVRRMGQVNLFSVVRGTGPNPPPAKASVLPLVDFSGTTVVVENYVPNYAASNSGHPTGVVYRPLAGDDQVPASWNGGEICVQHTSPVGRVGVSIVHEVDSAGCQPMDTYCSPSDCQAGVGGSLELPDPAALAGG